MIELIAIIIFLVGLIGMSVIIVRKVPVLVELPAQETGPSSLEKFRERIKNNGGLRSFSKELLLQKIVSKIRVLTLKTDNKTSNWLMELRQKSAKKRTNFSEDYWKKIRNRK